jgi:hypothetical protein
VTEFLEQHEGTPSTMKRPRKMKVDLKKKKKKKKKMQNMLINHQHPQGH